MTFRLLAWWLSMAALVGCATTEPTATVPHINLSPETMSFADMAVSRRDFGLQLSTNESDSLDNLAVLPGLRVRAVRSGSTADLAGIRAGDVILVINEIETNALDVFHALAQSDAESFRVQARRDTTVYETVMMPPRQRQVVSPEALYRVDPLRSRAGYSTRLLTRDDGRQQTVARVEALFPESPLKKLGIVPGDLIVSLEGEPVQSAQDLVNKLHARPLGQKVAVEYVSQSDLQRPDLQQPDLQQQSRQARVRLWEPRRRLSALSAWPLFSYRSSVAPEQVEVKVLDLILFPVFAYQRDAGEKSYRLLGLFRFGTGYGELVEEDWNAAR